MSFFSIPRKILSFIIFTSLLVILIYAVINFSTTKTFKDNAGPTIEQPIKYVRTKMYGWGLAKPPKKPSVALSILGKIKNVSLASVDKITNNLTFVALSCLFGYLLFKKYLT